MVDIEEAKDEFEKGVKNTPSHKMENLQEYINKPTKNGRDGECLICGYKSKYSGIQHHHIVPNRVGGSKQVPLFGTCHLEIEGYYAEKECTSEEQFRKAFNEFKTMKRSQSPL